MFESSVKQRAFDALIEAMALMSMCAIEEVEEIASSYAKQYSDILYEGAAAAIAKAIQYKE